MESKNKKLGDILVDAGKISEKQLQRALGRQSETNMKVGEQLVSMGLITEDEIIETVSSQLGIEKINLDNVTVDQKYIDLVPKEIAQKYELIPIGEEDAFLKVAMTDPLNVFAIDDVRYVTHKEVKPYITDKESINKAIEINYNPQSSKEAISDLQKQYGDEETIEKNPENDDDLQSAPAVRLTNSIIYKAVSAKASDIHIEPFEEYVIVRNRLDGVLSESMKIPQKLYSAVATRLKIMANMNIADKRVPQDGRIQMKIMGKKYDFRVSSLPTVYGEKIVIRILDRDSFLLDRKKLGFANWESSIMDEILKAPYGIILVSGPTGSGKTTTLYACLNELNTVDKNIVTVEDPVEYMLDGINQVHVNTKAGLTFASGLRSILRQDPDVIMVGEIRDEETAKIALRAAITGHMVFSTIHTNDAPSTISRLIDMGLESYLISDALIGVIAQRLVRKLCDNCKEKYKPEEWELNLLKTSTVDTLYRPVGCEKCSNTGYKGRTAIYEIMKVNSEIRYAIETGEKSDGLYEAAAKNGMKSLFVNCRNLVLDGRVSIEEMLRTVYAKD